MNHQVICWPSASSVEIFQSCARFMIHSKTAVVRRAWGVSALLWQVFLCELSMHIYKCTAETLFLSAHCVWLGIVCLGSSQRFLIHIEIGRKPEVGWMAD